MCFTHDLQVKSTTILLIVGIVGIGILSLNTVDVFSALKKDLATDFDQNESAQLIFLTVTDTTTNKQISFNSFSRIGVIRSSNPQFLLESVPSSENKEFLKFVSESLANSQKSGINFNPKFFDITIDIMETDGTIIESLVYKRCIIESYFVYSNDSKGTYSLLDRDTSKAEIRDVTRFDCTYLSIVV